MRQTVVIDASLATMWAVPEPHSEEALALASSWAQTATRLLAPSLLVAEVTNALYRRIVRGDMDLSTALAALEIVLGFPIEIREEPGLSIRAMTLAHDFKQPTTYGCHYLALAERYRCELWTGDRRLYNTFKDTIPWVKCVGE
jgi:predicted nucleic acid-binding protein